jgi:hypothetical protein
MGTGTSRSKRLSRKGVTADSRTPGSAVMVTAGSRNRLAVAPAQPRSFRPQPRDKQNRARIRGPLHRLNNPLDAEPTASPNVPLRV